MFRQTIMRAMQNRGLHGGATNHATERSRVDLTLIGDERKVLGVKGCGKLCLKYWLGIMLKVLVPYSMSMR